MIGVNNISVHYTGIDLFNDVSFIVSKGDRIGLVGKNGAGKSTLLKIIAGEIDPQKGSIAFPNEYRLGYLPQEMHLQDGKTVFEETEEAFAEAIKLEKLLEDINHQITTREDYESDEYTDLLIKLNEANERYSIIGGYEKEASIEKVLLGLGFLKEEFDRQTNTFSGGWRMRIELAKLLLQQPDCLLLDEPTNHLDIESIQWLEQFLSNYSGSIVLISHDRAFLDAVTNRTVEISMGKIYDYKTSYSNYVEQRQERREHQMSAFKNQQKQIEQTEKFIDRFRSKASKAVQVQSKIKQLNKVDRIEVDEEDTASIRFSFPPAPRAGKVTVKSESISKSFGEKNIFKNVSFEIERGQKVAFVGKNGMGKSTLSKIIVGALDYEGELEIGHNVKIGYYAQNQTDSLDGEKTLLKTIEEVSHGEMFSQARNMLGAFLFSGDTVEKKVKVLSGGEKARLAMCKLLLNPVNLLVLDEPTNHLDMRSKDVLKQALQRYDGSMIVVSHDRDFLRGMTEKVFEFKDHKVTSFFGDIYEYLKIRNLEELDDLNKDSLRKKEQKLQNISDNKMNSFDKREKEKELKKYTNRIGKVESEIADLEAKISQYDNDLKDPNKYQKMINDKSFFNQYEQNKKRLDELMLEWEDLSEKVGTMELEIRG
jgi:ATP-binding cassette, subfamily F, member 3